MMEIFQYSALNQESQAPDKMTNTRFDRGKTYNFEDIHRSLASISVFSSRRENLQPLLIYEMTCTGDSGYKSMNLRELLLYINQYAEDIDDFYYQSLEKEKRSKDYEDKLWESLEAMSTVLDNEDVRKVDENLLLPAPDDDGSYTAVKTLRFRDLRRLDIHTTSLNDTAILVRKHVAVFAMDPICAVIMADKVLLVVPDGADSLIGILHQYLKAWVDEQQKAQARSESMTETSVGLRNRFQKKPRRMNVDAQLSIQIPFEIHAYEALLMTVKELESQQVKYLTDVVDSLLVYYRSGTLLPLPIQSKMRQARNDLSMISNRLTGCLQALQHLLEDNEEMALMNLTLLKKKPSLYRFPLQTEIMSKHDDIEELVEFYISDLRSIATKIEASQNQIRNAVELVSVRLDTAENQLLFANTTLLILSSAVTFGNYFAGLFGMNLDQPPFKGSFAAVFCISGGLIVTVFALIFGYLKWARVLPSLFPA